MKECPRCGAKAFEDAAVCYGCLYQFTVQNVARESSLFTATSQGERAILQSNSPLGSCGTTQGDTEGVQQTSDYTQPPMNQGPPEFCIHLIPRHCEWGGWKWDCSVEIEEKVKHEVVGRHALQIR